jgi:ABC-2 type transport system permease protein
MGSLYRTASFFTTWSAELLRQPAMMAALVIGPFLILLAFAQAVDVTRIEPRVIVVQPGTETQDLQPVPEELEEYVEVVSVTNNAGWARRQLRAGNVDGVVILPDDPEGSIERGEHVPMTVVTDDIDPFRLRLTEAYLNEQLAFLNQRTLAETFEQAQAEFVELEEYISTAREYVRDAQRSREQFEETRESAAELAGLLSPVVEFSGSLASAAESVPFLLRGAGITREEVRALRRSIENLRQAMDALERGMDDDADGFPTAEELEQIDRDLAQIEETGSRLRDVPPEVLSAPFALNLVNIALVNPTFAAFYSPAVLALLLQHLAVSLAALTGTRIREGGLLDVLRIAPARPIEVVNGNYLSFGTILLLVGAAVLALMMLLVAVPMYGSYVLLALLLGLLIAVSLGIGFVIAMISTSEKHAAQLAMLLLLASVFFSGLVISLERIEWPIRAVSFALPATYAIRGLQDVMLRGVLREPLDLVILGVAALVLYGTTVVLLSRRFRSS